MLLAIVARDAVLLRRRPPLAVERAIASALPLTHAIAIGRPLFLGQWPESALVNVAVLAAYGAGRFASIDEGIAAMVKPGRVVEPDPANVAAYAEIYARYKALYPALKSALGSGA